MKNVRNCLVVITKDLGPLRDEKHTCEGKIVTHRLEETFNIGEISDNLTSLDDNLRQLKELDDQVPAITDLSSSDKEMDDLAQKAVDSFTELMDLGMNVEQRFAAPIFDAASKMLGHAVLAKTAKIDKKLKAIDLELKRQRLRQMAGKSETDPDEIEGDARVLDRNELLRMLKDNKP